MAERVDITQRTKEQWSRSGLHRSLASVSTQKPQTPARFLRHRHTLDVARCVNYSQHMLDVIKSEAFDQWLIGLKDRLARIRVLARIDRLAAGNAGDAKPVGAGISELRIDHGPG